MEKMVICTCIFYLTHHLHFILHMQRSNLFWDNVFPSVTKDVNNYLPRLKDTYPGPFLLLQIEGVHIKKDIDLCLSPKNCIFQLFFSFVKALVVLSLNFSIYVG